MMKLRDALSIATIKLKTRKLRTAFAGFSISIGIVIILAFLFGTTGVVRLGHSMFTESLTNRYFAIEAFQPRGIIEYNEFGPVVEDDAPEPPAEATDVNAYRAAHPEVSGAYQQVRADGAYGLRAVEGETPNGLKENGTILLATESLFVQDVVRSGYQFDSLIDGKVPVLVAANLLVSPEDYAFADPRGTAKSRYEAMQKRTEEIIGKTFVVEDRSTETPTDTGIQVIVVGVEPGMSFFGSTFLEGGITVPLWAMHDVPALASLYEQATKEYRVLAEFPSKDARDAFVKKSFDAMVFSNASEPPVSFVNAARTVFDELDEVVSFFRSVALGVGGFFLAISGIMIMTTLGKIISDSQKEIAVFRAVGAHKRDVKKMYFGYAWLLATIGFILGTAIAIGLDIAASVKWGDTVYYEFAGQAVRAGFTKPTFVFLGFTPLEWLLVYAGVVIVGLLAAALPVRRASKIEPIQVLREL